MFDYVHLGGGVFEIYLVGDKDTPDFEEKSADWTSFELGVYDNVHLGGGVCEICTD